MYNTHYLILYTTSQILYSEQQQLYAMRCAIVAPVEAGSHVGCQRQLPGTLTVADRDCAADGELQRTSKLRTTTGGENVSMYSINSIFTRESGCGGRAQHYLF